MMKRAVFSIAGAVLLTVAAAGNVAADKPIRGCPDDFQQWDILKFQRYLLSEDFYNSLPPKGQAMAADIRDSIDTPEWLDGAAFYDKNADGLLCLKQGPANKGHLYGWVFNAVDNTSNHEVPI